MGFWDWLTGKKPANAENSQQKKRKRGQRGPGRSKAERDAIEKTRFERDLRRHFPDQYRRVKLMEWYRLSPDEAEEFLSEGQRAEKRNELLKDVLGPGLQVLAAMMQRNAPMPSAAPQPTAQLPPAQAETLPAPQQQPETNGMSRVSQELIAELSTRNPSEAAAWLLRRPENGAKQFVDLVSRTPDDQIPALLGMIGQAAPDLAGAMAWLAAPDRSAWTIATVQALRASVPGA